MTEKQIRVMQEVQRLLGPRVTVASQAGRTTPEILSNRLVMLSGAPDNAEGWRLAFRMMMEISIITPKQQKVLDDAFQPGAPLRVRTEREMRKRGLGELLTPHRWDRREAQVWAFQFHMEGAVTRNTVSRLFEVLKHLYYRIRHLIMGVGLEAAEDIFRQAAKGVLGHLHDKRLKEKKSREKSNRRTHAVFVLSEQGEVLASYQIEADSFSRAARIGLRRFLREWKEEHGARMPPKFHVDRYPPPPADAMEEAVEQAVEITEQFWDTGT